MLIHFQLFEQAAKDWKSSIVTNSKNSFIHGIIQTFFSILPHAVASQELLLEDLLYERCIQRNQGKISFKML